MSSLLAVERIETLNEERCFSSGGAGDISLGQARFRAQPQVDVQMGFLRPRGGAGESDPPWLVLFRRPSRALRNWVP